MTEQRQKLLDRFDKWLDSKPRKQIISAQCANIAEEYAEEQLILHDVVGQSEQLVCDCGDSNMTWYGNDNDKQWFCFNCKKEAN
jgi:hypothetical protein